MAELRSNTRELTAVEYERLQQDNDDRLRIARPFVSIDDRGGEWLCWTRVFDAQTAEAWRERAL